MGRTTWSIMTASSLSRRDDKTNIMGVGDTIMPKKSAKSIVRVRSSVSGRFVPPSKAKTSPKTTETEVIRRKQK